MGVKRLGFILLLILVSVVLPNVGKVKAGSTVYIRADGSIDPVTAPISTVDNVIYTFTGDVYDSIVVERSNIIIDGNGFTLQGTGNGTGIDLTDRDGVAIKNTQIRDFEYGIHAVRSDNSIITANNITTGSFGIRLADSSNNNVSENTLTNNHFGIAINRISNSIVSANTVTNSQFGIYGFESSSNTITENTLTDNFYGFYFWDGGSYNSISGNIITDSPNQGILLGNSYNCTISENTIANSLFHGVFFFSSTNTTLSENTLTANREGVHFENTSYTTISGNNITNSYEGIRGQDTEFVTVTENILIISTYRGISISHSFHSTILGNTIANSEYGIFSYNVSEFTVSGNTLTDNYVGIYFAEISSSNVSGNTMISSTVLGFEIYDSFNSTFSSNTVTNSEHGAYLWNASDTLFSRNTITDITTVGIALYNSSSNTVYGNTITNNLRGLYLWTVSNNTVSGNNITGSTGEGIRIDEATNCVVTGNIVTNNNDGIYFYNVSHSTISGNMLSSNGGSNGLSQSSYITVSNNFIFNNVIGFSILQSSNNTFYHNNFVNNSIHVSTNGGTNVWDNGFPSGGNYWSDYTERYPEAEELNDSGIWDTPYIINGENQDDYPLMEPYSYELMITTTDGGTTDPPAGKHYYPAGSLVNVTTSPNTGYEFDYWLLDSEERVENSITLIMDGNHTLEAFFVDASPPTTSHDYDGTWHTSDITITLSAIDDESGVSETYYRINDGTTKTVSADGQPLVNTENANNTLQYWSVDNAGNEETPNTLTDIRLDKTAPASLINLAATTGNGGWLKSDITMSLSATDSVSGVDKTEYSFNNVNWKTYSAPFKITDEGNFSVYFKSTDKAGNVEVTKTELGKLDKTAPVSAIDTDGTIGDDGWFTSQVTVSLSSTDSISDVDKTEYSLDNVNWNVYSAPFTIADDGDFSVYYRSIDKAGNVENTKTETGKLDKTAPTSQVDLTAATENNGWFTSDVTVSLSATDSVSGVDKTEYHLDTASWETYVSQLTIVDEGVFSVYYRSVDKAGNVETVNVATVNLDRTMPQGSVTVNENAMYTNSLSVTLTLSAEDATSGVAQMRFSNDGTEWSNWETYSASKIWTLSAADETKTVYVQFKDNADLVSESYQDTIMLDTTPPIADAGQDQTVKVDTPITFDAGASSDNVGIISYSWDFGDGTTGTSEMTTHTYNTTGTYTVTLTTEDAAGNTKSAQITVTVVTPELLPLWMIGVIAAVILAVVALVFFMKKRKK